jgi:hypothetical protein
MIKLSRVGHATFETPDLDRAIAYYTDVQRGWCSTPRIRAAPSWPARSDFSQSRCSRVTSRN